MVVHDYRPVPSSHLHPLLYVANPFPQVAARNILPCYVANMGQCCVCAFLGQTRREPVRFARRVFEDLTETKCFEPPRGSWTYVSLVVVAVHDNRLILPKPSSRPGI